MRQAELVLPLVQEVQEAELVAVDELSLNQLDSQVWTAAPLAVVASSPLLLSVKADGPVPEGAQVPKGEHVQ